MSLEFLVDYISVDDIQNPIVRAGIAYWQGLCRGRAYPARPDVSPSGMRKFLANTALVRVIDDGADYEYRIAGEAHVMSHGIPLQGKKMSELDGLDPAYRPVLKSLYDTVAKSHAPQGVRGAIKAADGAPVHYKSESAFLPLGPDEKTVDHILVFTVYEGGNQASAGRDNSSFAAR